MPDVPLHVHLDTDAVTASVLKAVHLDEEAIRAQVAEEIAQAIDELDDCGYAMYQAAYDTAARVARGYTLAGQDPADRKEQE